jgi:hypothetical protein
MAYNVPPGPDHPSNPRNRVAEVRSVRFASYQTLPASWLITNRGARHGGDLRTISTTCPGHLVPCIVLLTLPAPTVK